MTMRPSETLGARDTKPQAEAVVVAYDWLDIGIGMDTNGSMRRPKTCCGVFGLRISHGVFPHTRISTVFRRFDVHGLFARDLDVMLDFATEWYAARLEAPKSEGLPRKLVCFTHDTLGAESLQKQAIMGVVRNLVASLGIEVIEISPQIFWQSKQPGHAKGEKLHYFFC
ncbi:hypothetical protein EJ02DRAFT_455138 [Clathrospora elynae]|uniref:Amidase domain-containing protein n=1 Tax=Clathrospora elynae TaxID=706981 RepID=A0A6A5SP82_9PLEO|nr:hypothetical protein EJ02DRAFT_455138 [Clathrospora elynae]